MEVDLSSGSVLKLEETMFELGWPRELSLNRAVGSSENPGVSVLFGGHGLSPFVDIGLTDLPTSGGAMATTRSTPGTTGLHSKSDLDCLTDCRFRDAVRFSNLGGQAVMW